MQKYMDFAYIYDKLTFDVEYKKTADFIDEVIKKYGIKNTNLVLDLACGTGTMCNLLSDKGYDLTGIDFSENMLSVATEKSVGKNILYLNQDICQFELYGTMDAICCLLDSINHITDIKKLDKLFSLANNYLNPEGLFVFDINSPYKFENILADNIFTFDTDEIYYVWENDYDIENKLCDFYLTFFVNENEKYTRFDELHTERCYEDEEIEKLADKNGFEILKKCDGYSMNDVKEDSERIFYILKKK